jgi:NADPH:quinone reductase-like Zn-dependent oxidoreductase
MTSQQPGTDAAPGTTAMRAIVHDVYGDTAGVLRLADVARPVPGAGEVLVRVAAAGVDRGVWHLMAGKPYAARLAFGVRAPRQPVLGMALAGTVEALGTGVTTLAVGDGVYGVGQGTFAEFSIAKADRLAPRPANLTPAEAAALPVSATTALQAVRDHGHVQAGQKVLVIGASGGVGSYAVQIAKAFGAEVTGVCSTAKVDLVRSLGADAVIDYTRSDITDAGTRYDVVLDIGGDRPVRQLRQVLTATGTLVIVGGEGGGRWLGMGRQLRAALLSPFVGQRLGFFVASDTAADLVALTGLVESGRVRPALERTFPLADAPAAVDHVAGGRARGKVVVEVSR